MLCTDVLSRKKAKPCCSSVTEVADELDRSSTDESDKPSSNLQESGSTENDLLRPLLLSQSGKFIPKFSAKKRFGSCVVKIESCVASASEAAEVGLESQLNDASATDELKDNSSHSVSTENKPSYSDDSQPANKHDEQLSSSNNGLIESISSAKQELIPVGTDLLAEEETVRDHGDDGSSSTVVEEKVNSGQNGNVSVQIQQCTTSENSDQDGLVRTTPVSSSDSYQHVGTDEVAGEMPRTVSHEDCTQPQSLEVSDNETTCNEVMDRSDAGSDGGSSVAAVEAQVNSEDALNHSCLVSDVVVVADKDVSLTLKHDEASTSHPDVVADGNDRPRAELAMYVGTDNKTSDVSATVGELDVSGVGDDKIQTVVDGVDPQPANRSPAEDTDAPSANSMVVSAVVEAKQFVSGSSEPPLFDDFLDLTDSQLCQLDDVSR